MQRMSRLWLPLAAVVGLIAAGACGGDESSANNDCAACGPGLVCIDGACVEPLDDGGIGGTDGGGDSGDTDGGAGAPFDASSCPSERQCESTCCDEGERCALGAICAVVQDPCTTSDQCWFDSYCVEGECIPYGVPPSHTHDATCKLTISIDAIAPAVQCRWTGPPDGDLYPGHFHVMSTPVVVDFNFDDDPGTLLPSIIFTTFPTSGSYHSPGVLRVINGADCSQQFSIDDPGDATMAPASVAVGDIDSDGRAEIVAAAHAGGLLAFRFDSTTGGFVRLWRSGTCAGGAVTPDSTGGTDKWSGPSIHDLNDDGSPEIIYGGTVYDSNGCILSSTLGFVPYSVGVVPVIADVDEDGQMELVLGNAIYQWSGGDWQAETYFAGGVSAGQVAVADFGEFPLASFNGEDRPEVVVISAGTARVQTLEGTVVFGPVAIPGGGTGGPPTIADFDGDGRREFASAGGGQYAVFDLDCVAGGDSAGCGGQAKTDGVLWSQPSQDMSSNVTGSSVFDFDADGSAEAVYADECFLRIYQGATGEVVYSAARSSGTTYENPVIVDVDGDYRTEIVSAVNDYAGTLNCPSTDPLLPAATFEVNHGIVVLRDEQDRWAASRPVWNQHAYAVTHVGDLGRIPKTSEVKRNWSDPALNNFRQNVQGDLEALGVPDLTAGGDVGGIVQCNGAIASIPARVRNRGTLPMVGGTVVAFFEGSEDGPLLCSTPIPVALQVGECFVVTCEADLGGNTIDVFVTVDPDSATDECYENNNAALYRDVACGQIPH